MQEGSTKSPATRKKNRKNQTKWTKKIDCKIIFQKIATNRF